MLASSVTFRHGLAAKLGKAAREAGVANGKACAALDSFVAMVQRKTGSGGLTTILANEWVAQADAVRADLDCTA